MKKKKKSRQIPLIIKEKMTKLITSQIHKNANIQVNTCDMGGGKGERKGESRLPRRSG